MYFVPNQLVYSIYLKQQISIMQQFRASMFHTVVDWHKLGKVDNECTLHNFVVLVINLPKIIKVSKNLTKLWQKKSWLFFFSDTVYFWKCGVITLNSTEPVVEKP